MPDPIRLFLVNENVGGHGTMHRHLVKCLDTHPGIDASVFHVAPPGLARKVIAAPVPGLARLDLDLHVLRAQLLASRTVRRALARRRGSWDVLHVYTHSAALLSTATLAAGPSVVSLDTTSSDCATRLPCRYPTRFTPWATRPAVALEKRVYRAATLVVAQSEWTRQTLLERYRLPADKLRVIPFGIVPPSHVRDGPPPDRPRITFVGRSLERKGGRRLLDLWRAHLSATATLTLVTPERVPPEPGLEVRNDVTAANGRLWPILASTSLMALPSEVDASSYALLEAMGAGVPVVVLRSGAAPELVGADAYAGGLVVEPGDDQALVGAIERLATDMDLNRRMGRAARTRVANHFDARITTAALVETIGEAFDRFHAGSRAMADEAG